MLYLDYNEKQMHGTKDFPLAFYHVDNSHPRYEMPFHWHKEYEIVRVELFHMPEGGFVTRDIASVAFFPENKAEQFKLVRVLKGQFRLMLADTEIIAKPEESFFIPSGALHGGMI